MANENKTSQKSNHEENYIKGDLNFERIKGIKKEIEGYLNSKIPKNYDPVKEFERFHNIISKYEEPHYILLKNDKSPAVKKGESWKDSKYKLPFSVAKAMIKEGQAVGIVFKGKSFALDVDIYKLEGKYRNELLGIISKYLAGKGTLIVRTPSGGLHFYFLSSDNEEIGNATSPKYHTELRYSWQYVVTPGSFVKTKSNPDGGYYYIVSENEPLKVSKNDFLWILRDSFMELLNNFNNIYDISLKELCLRDGKLLELLKKPEVLVATGQYPSRSEVTFALINKLYYYYFDDVDIKKIVKTFHPYKKTIKREDWIPRALDKIKKEYEENKKERYNPKKDNAISQKAGAEDIFLLRAEQIYSLNPFFYDEDKKIFYLWNEEFKEYRIVDEEYMVAFVLKIYGDYDLNLRMNITKASYYSRLLKALKLVGIKNKPKIPPSYLIKFKDKIYDIKKDIIYEATPDFLFTNTIPWEIGESEETPILDKLFIQWVGEDYKDLLYEIIAYSMLRDYPLHRIFILFGSGRNGKSTFLKILSNFIGKKNITSTELERIEKSRFEVSKLYQKLVCMIGETNFTAIKNSAILKSLSGQDYVSAEYKHKKPFDFINYAKMIISTNNMPLTKDLSPGFFSRIVIVDFPNTFNETRDILSEIPEEEYKNLALKSIKILKKLLNTRKFTGEGDGDIKRERYEERANPVIRFIKHSCYVDHDNEDIYIPTTTFYEEFKNWIMKNDPRFSYLTYQQVKEFIGSLGFTTKRMYLSDNTRRNCIVGIRFKTKEEIRMDEENKKKIKKENTYSIDKEIEKVVYEAPEIPIGDRPLEGIVAELTMLVEDLKTIELSKEILEEYFYNEDIKKLIEAGILIPQGEDKYFANVDVTGDVNIMQ